MRITAAHDAGKKAGISSKTSGKYRAALCRTRLTGNRFRRTLSAMIESLTFLLLAQLTGEVIVRALGVPVPGPVVGLVLLAAFIAWRGIPARLHETSLGLLRNLSLLFVPAGVGVMRQADVLVDNWVALTAALVLSTMATLAVTALVFRWAQNRFGGAENEESAE